jgi:putative ABC transport system permease protein
MSLFRNFAIGLRSLFRKNQVDRELNEELGAYLEMEAAEKMKQGMSRKDALRAVRLERGSLEVTKEVVRSGGWESLVQTCWQDLRYAFRILRKSPGFTTVAVLTLALGIGAATAIFSVIDNVLLDPFPEKGAGRMVFFLIHNTQQSQEAGRGNYTAAEVLEFGENNRVFDGITAATGEPVLYKHGEGTEWFIGAHVTPGTFEFFGMPARYGRVMQASDYEPGSPPVFVMRYKAWMERFGGDLSMMNRTFVLNGTPRTLVGIMPPRFAWYGADVYIPEALTRGAKAGLAYSAPSWFLLGRLKPGVSIQQAEADLTVVAHRLARIYPQNYPRSFTVQVRKRVDAVVGRFAATLYTVLAAVGLLLLIACSNVANLMLARATTREKEFALRAALGAGRARLIRLLMVESLVLAMAGAALGTFIAWGGLKLLVTAMPQNLIPAQSVIELNSPVLAFTLCVAVLTALIFGLVPALQSSRPDLNDPLRESGKGVSGGFRGRWVRDVVVVMEVALSLTLLIGAGLLMRSFVALRAVHLGLQADHVFQMGLALPADRYKTAEQRTKFLRPLLLRLKALPGVVDAAASSGTPIYNGGVSKMEIAGKTHEEELQSLFRPVSEGYFRVLRIEFKQGQGFSEAAVNDARKVAVVNETFVRKYLPNENPIGQRVHLASLDTFADPHEDTWLEIVGIVGDVTNDGNRGLQVPIEPEVWVPYTIAGSNAPSLMVRTKVDPGAMMNALRKEVWATDSGVALIHPSTLEDFISEQLYAGPRFGFVLMTIFGSVGLILVTVGVYSILAYSTTQKTHEIGIRMALGAEGTDVVGMVVRTGLRPVVAGIAIGIAVSPVLGGVIGSQLVGVTAYDPPTLAATAVLLTMTAAIACWIPARRAARVDPMIALKYE